MPLVFALALAGGARAQEHTVYFRTSDPGVTRAITTWGVDTAWPSPDNMRNGLIHMGVDEIDMVRICFFADEPLDENGELSPKTRERLDLRKGIAGMAGDKPWSLLPATEDLVHPWYKDGNRVRADRWVEMLEATQKYLGKPIEVIEPFNEPDYGWGQGTPEDLREILRLLAESPCYQGTKLAGPATLNCDQASRWYSVIKDHVSVGSTHTLAGRFQSYIDFMREVQANGHEVSNPEAHSVMEVIAGAEYGLTDSTWWGPPFLTRGLFVKSCQGKRLAYAEDLERWTAAAVYRAPDGVIRAFIGAVERQSTPTTYRLVCGDRAVWFNGEGPQRDYPVTIGRHGEEFVEITWGDDVPPALDGRRFVIVNRRTGKALALGAADRGDGAPLRQGDGDRGEDRQWDVVRVRHGYYTLTSPVSERTAAIADWDQLGHGIPVCQSGNGRRELQQWFIEYVDSGYFHLRNRHTGKYMQADGDAVVQGGGTAGEAQQWRFFPAEAGIDYQPPSPPSGLTATPRAISVSLAWDRSRDDDVGRYTVYRSNTAGGPYNPVGATADTRYVDTSANRGIPYHYVVRATDRALNHSGLSAEAAATPTGGELLVAHFAFEGDLRDATGNENHGTAQGTPAYDAGRDGSALVLVGMDDYVALPPGMVNCHDLTVAAWIYWEGGLAGQRIFDFGNDPDHGLSLTPKSEDGTMRFVLRNGDVTCELNTVVMPKRRWTHLALVLEDGTAELYVNGRLMDSGAAPVRPSDLNPLTVSLGRSLRSGPNFRGMLDEVRVYNHGVARGQLQAWAGDEPDILPAGWTPESGEGVPWVISGEIETCETVAGRTVILSERAELHVTGTENPLEGSRIHLNSPDAWLFLEHIPPSAVLARHLGQVRIGGAPAVNAGNVRVAEYAAGSVVIPQSARHVPMEVWTEPRFEGGSRDLSPGTVYDDAALDRMNKRVASFTLRRGYAVTIAQEPDGTGLSRVYVAQDGGLSVSVLPAELRDAIQYIRVVPWQWTGARAADGDDPSRLAYTQMLPAGAGPGAHYVFDGDAVDASGNGNDGMVVGMPAFGRGHADGNAIELDGVRDHVVLPAGVGDSTTFSFAAWINWKGGAVYQRIFDLGNGTERYLFLTPNSANGTLRFAISTDSYRSEQQLNARALRPGSWTHVAVTLGGGTGRLYVNGERRDTNERMRLTPADIGVKNNYLGRSQFAPDPLFRGQLQDVVFADRVLTPDEVAALARPGSAGPASRR